MKIYILIILCLTLFSCKKEVNEKPEFSVFDTLQEGYQTMEFISSSKSNTLKSDEISTLLNKLITEDFEEDNQNNIEIANNVIPVKSYSRYFKNSIKGHSLLIESISDKTELSKRFKEVNSAIETYSGIQHGYMGKYYLKLEDSTPANLNATFRNDKYIFNIKRNLSFINPNPDDWNNSEIQEFKEAVKNLNEQLSILLDEIVLKSELIYKPVKGQNLSSQERLFGLIKFWTEVKYNFAFFDQVPDLDWDKVLQDYIPRVQADQDNKSYYKLLTEVCALLEDGHTNIYFPFELQENLGNVPLKFKEYDEKIILTNFSKSLSTKLDIGFRLISIDNIPVDDHLNKNVLPYISASTDYIRRNIAINKMLEGKEGNRVDLKLSNGQDSIIFMNIQYSNEKVDWHFELEKRKLIEFYKKNDIGILELNSFGSSRIVEEFLSHIQELTSLNKLIIDLRNNGGGNSEYGYQILDYFSSKDIITSKWKTREHKPAFMAWGKNISGNLEELSQWEKDAKKTYDGDFWYESQPDTIKSTNNILQNKNVIILIGNHTASAAEDFLIAAESISLGYTVGDFTYGSTGQPLEIRLPGGGSGRICTKKDSYPDGKEFVGYGIKPDVILRESISDHILGKDVVLETALNMLSE